MYKPVRTNLLIVEDCTLIAEAYRRILLEITTFDFSIKLALNCDEAIKKINQINYQIILLDLQLPTSSNEKFTCGEDVGLYFRRKFPLSKIIILTSYANSLRALNIINGINPEAFLVKSDISEKSLKQAITDVLLKDKKYYSNVINGYAESTFSNNQKIDDFDRKILYHLSMGEKTKDISNFVALSYRAIEDRKNKLKILFNITENNTTLVKEAKKKGII